jgi:topoisomerase-4 subunit A
VACVGINRKVLVFPVAELSRLGRGKGVRLQKYADKEGELSDVKSFNLADGLQWLDAGGRTRTVTELDEWRGKRAASGRMAPRGFPRDNKFNA